MATCNFCEMKYGMPMISGATIEEAYALARYMFDIETDEGVGELELHDAWEDMYEYARSICEELNNTLKFHKVSIRSGYYESFQLWVDEIHSDRFDLNRESRYCIDNDDAQYYFDMCRSHALRRAASEKRRIASTLLRIAKNNDYLHHIKRTALFSSGEAWYSIVR